MKKISKIAEIYNNKELKEMSIEQQEKWLRAKIVMQFVYLREKQGYTQHHSSVVLVPKHSLSHILSTKKQDYA